MDKNDLREIHERASTAELEEIIYLSQDEYSPEAITVIKDILSKRDDSTIGITEKICPYCKNFILISQDICTCGYNFSRHNIAELQIKKNKDVAYQSRRGVLNIFKAIAFFIVAIIVYALIQDHYKVPRYFVILIGLGVGGLLIRGLYQLIKGKKPSSFNTFADMFSSEKDIETEDDTE